MADKTTNFNLTKPAQSDSYDIKVHNDNMDIIDEQLKEIEDKCDSLTSDDGGGVIGTDATTTHGGAIGESAKSTNGGAVGQKADTTHGGAIGYQSKSTNGGAVGYLAEAAFGGAIGYQAKTSGGAAIGNQAKTENSEGLAIDAVQLGGGTNNTSKTLQVYNYRMMDANGLIPADRLKNAARFKIGSYKGTGACGVNSPNTLTFDEVPKFLVIRHPQGFYHAELIYGQDGAITEGDMDYATVRNINVTWSDKTVTWYSTFDQYVQLNVADTTYFYFVIY